MGVGLYISLESPVAGVAADSVPGKGLARNFDELNKQCERLGLISLADFVSLDPSTTADFLEGEGLNVKGQIPEEKWFDPGVGLQTIRGLLRYYSNAKGNSSDRIIIADLEACRKVLANAAEAQIRFHFTFDLP